VRLRSIQDCRSPEESGLMPFSISGDKYDPNVETSEAREAELVDMG
jgi:hypothetical protein